MQDRRDKNATDREIARLAAIVDGAFDQPSLAVRLDRLEVTVRNRAGSYERLVHDFPDDYPLADKGVAARVVAHVAASDTAHRALLAGTAVAARGVLGIALTIAQVVILGWLVIHGVPVAR